MHRTDLLTLTTDDLALLSNRGLVKRAQKEIAAGNLTYQLTPTADEGLRFDWSDGVTCHLPENEVLSDRHCTCSALSICRHLIRSILAYQFSAPSPSGVQESDRPSPDSSPASVSPNPAQTAPPSPSTIWNPGEITDQTLARYFRPTQLKQLKKLFKTGQVIEVTCSQKPLAQLHSFPHTLRFLVKGDLRYTYCDCGEEAPCRHVPLAIWAFRQLSSDQLSGIISTEPIPLATPVEIVSAIETTLHDLVATGLRGLNASFMAILKQLEQQCLDAALPWIANTLADLILLCEFYRHQNGRFSPDDLQQVVVELCMRMDAMRSQTGAIPQLFIRGPQTSQDTELGATRLINLGCGVSLKSTQFTFNVYMQDTHSGQTLTFASKSYPPPEANTTFWETAHTNALKNTNWSTLGAGQLLIKRGICTPNGQLRLKRHQPAIVNPQSFEWEKLRSPLLVEDVTELQQHLQLKPPRYLRSRRTAENFSVLAVSRVETVRFSSMEQAIIARVYDHHNHSLELYFPYTQAAQAGTEALLTGLNQHQTRFVSGSVAIRSTQIQIIPTAVVFDMGDRRQMLQPWIHAAKTSDKQEMPLSIPPANPTQVYRSMGQNPLLAQYLNTLSNVLLDILLLGLITTPSPIVERLDHLAEHAISLGFQTLSSQLSTLSIYLKNPPDQPTVLTQQYLDILVFLEALHLSEPGA